MATTLIIPGLHSSGSDHWQTWFEEHIPGSLRVIQSDWSKPDLPEWSSRIRRDIGRTPGSLYIVAHSFGVLAAIQAAADYSDRIAGALLVAPADPEKFGIADYLPAGRLDFASVIVGSTNDPWMSLDQAAHWADIWGADFVNLGASGHINEEAGFGPWPEGLALFTRLRRAAQPALAETHDAPSRRSKKSRGRVRAHPRKRFRNVGLLAHELEAREPQTLDQVRAI